MANIQMLRAAKSTPLLLSLLLLLNSNFVVKSQYDYCNGISQSDGCDSSFEYFGGGNDAGVEVFPLRPGSMVRCVLECPMGSTSAVKIWLEKTADPDIAMQCTSGNHHPVTTLLVEGGASEMKWESDVNGRGSMNFYCTCEDICCGPNPDPELCEPREEREEDSENDGFAPLPPEISDRESPAPSGCFAGSTLVQVYEKGGVLMKDLQVGDRVLTGSNQYQPIYSFGHYHDSMESTFFQIFTSDNQKKPLEMTGNHLVFVTDSQEQVSSSGQKRTLRADQLSVGDYLWNTNQHASIITKIARNTKQGLYMPLTRDGTIVVENGIVASTYVSIHPEAPYAVNTAKLFPGIYDEHTLLHWWLSPYRMICTNVEGVCGGTHNTGNDDEGILQWLLAGQTLAKYADDVFLRLGPNHSGVATLLLGIPVFCLFGLLNFLELIVMYVKMQLQSSFLMRLAFTTTTLAIAGATMMLLRRKKRDSHDSNKDNNSPKNKNSQLYH